MSWLQRLNLRRMLNSKIRGMDEYKRTKYLSLLRVAYFFATSSLCLTLFYIKDQNEKQEEEKKNQRRLEAGEPVIRDDSEAHAKLRKTGAEVGVLYKYDKEKGWHIEEYHREEYLSRLKKKAFLDAQEAQRKALAEGRELPPDAILLIDESGSS